MARTPIAACRFGSPVLSIRSIEKAFVRGPVGLPQQTAALAGVSLDVEAGELLGVVGPGGAGKTTLLRCAAGILKPDRGVVEWCGERLVGGCCPSGLAYVPAMPAYYPFLTVRDVLEFRIARAPNPCVSAEETIASALGRVDLENSAASYVYDLPREAIKRLAVAEALAGDPKVLLFDSTACDLAVRHPPVVQRALALEASNGRAVVIAVRDAGVIASVASRIVMLDRGKNAGSFSSDARLRPASEPDASFAPIARSERYVAERLH